MKLYELDENGKIVPPSDTESKYDDPVNPPPGTDPGPGPTDPDDPIVPRDNDVGDLGDGTVSYIVETGQDRPKDDDVGDVDDGETDPNNVLPPIENEVPEFTIEDYSDELGKNKTDIRDEMDYNIPGVQEVPFTTSSGTADPTFTPWDVTREQTVAGQLEDLYDRDGPFFELARQRAIRQALASGGQNTAMAGAFGELAAMDQAFKVGFADAATYARSAEFNAAMKNQFSLAEQRFVHNALLSDQAFRQAGALQTQRIEGQMEAIMLDYQGRSALMDQELANWFLQAKQGYQYSIGTLYEQAKLAEGQAGRDFARTMVLNGMNTMTNFYTNAFSSVLQYANNPSFTPAQQMGALQNGMSWMKSQWDVLQAYWGQWAAGGPPIQNFMGGTGNWYDFSQPYTGG